MIRLLSVRLNAGPTTLAIPRIQNEPARPKSSSWSFHNITPLFCRIIFLVVALLLFLPLAPAASVKVEVTVTGVSDPLLKNVLARLTIFLQKDNERLQANAVRRLHRQAEDDIRSALAPFGYYNPAIKSDLSKTDDVWHALYAIDQGPPVVVEEVSLALAGAGRNNDPLLAALAEFPVKKGDTLNQELYEQGKKARQPRLRARVPRFLLQ